MTDAAFIFLLVCMALGAAIGYLAGWCHRSEVEAERRRVRRAVERLR